ncbi:MAG: cysteine--tRNA ligase [Oligoflexales bacterium]
MRTLFVRNSLSGKREQIVPIQPGHIGLYACGVTVYDDCHIGHAMQAIFFDVMRHYLEFAGYKVTYVRNYTDVDDKIIQRAQERNMSPKDLAETMIKSSENDMLALGVTPPTHAPKVSESINDIIELIETLIQKDAAYSVQGDVYYRVRSKKDYGKLSNRHIDDLRSGARIAQGDIKEDPLDFALWKADTTKDASWKSPWGQGRPGWHIECSAMSHKILGPQFDLHGGGRDLIFPHHENEIAQSESAHGCQYAKYWLHSGLLTIQHQKMSKSLGNSITIQKFLEQWPAEVLRIAYLHNHYASNVDLSNEVFSRCLRKLIYAYETLCRLHVSLKDTPKSEGLADTEEEFHKCMSDDFNTPVAMSIVNQSLKLINRLLAKKPTPENIKILSQHAHTLKSIGQVLGLFQAEPQSFLKTLRARLLSEIGLQEAEIQNKISERNQARSDKNWAESDRIRDELLKHGILICDHQTGTTWSVQPEE